MHVRARHGVMEQERIIGADFLVSVIAETSQEKATETDELGDTVSYAAICDTVCEEMARPSRLLEHVCGRVCHRLLHDFPLLCSVTVRISKMAPPISGLQCEGCGVELSVSRDCCH